MSLRKILSIIFIAVPFYAHSNVFNWFGIGMSTGYRFNNSSIYLEHNDKKFIFSGEYIINNDQGIGFSLGANYKFNFNKTPFEFDLGGYFTRLLGGNDAFEWNSQNIRKNTVFFVDDADYFIPSITGRYNLEAYEKRKYFRRKGTLSVFCRLGYRISVNSVPNVKYVSGDPYPDELTKLEKSVKEGIGVSFGFSINIGRKEKIIAINPWNK